MLYNQNLLGMFLFLIRIPNWPLLYIPGDSLVGCEQWSANAVLHLVSVMSYIKIIHFINFYGFFTQNA